MTSRFSFLAAAAATGLSALACSGGDETEFSAPQGSQPQPQGVQQVFEDHYSENGTLSVYESADGLSITFTGLKGVDQPSATALAGSFADLYLALHPELDSVPTEVAALSARLSEQAANAPRLEQDEVAPLAAPVTKSQAFFDATICQIFTVSPTEAYYPTYCKYERGSTLRPGVRTSSTVDALDFVYVLNDGNRDVIVTLYDKVRNTPVPGMATLTMHGGGSWGFASWGGTFNNQYAGARFVEFGSGFVGITHHDRIPAP
jgi:hypothetical protein